MSALKENNFDISLELFDDDEEFNLDNSNQESEELSHSSQKYEERKMLYEIYMADPTIPSSEKNCMAFWKSLYHPTYSTQNLFKLMKQKNLLGPCDASIIEEKSKEVKSKHFNEDFGYDGTFLATTKELIEEQKRRENIPKEIKEIYKKKGIVNASQIYDIEQKLNGESDESNDEMKPSTSSINQAPKNPVNNDLNASLRELSRTLSEKHEISQIMKEIQNISDLDVSLTELSEKIQYSSKAEHLINHTISCSQRLRVLDDICTNDICINTCDVLSDDELKKSSQESDCDKSPIKTQIQNICDINDNIPDISDIPDPIPVIIPKQVAFSFASGKSINIDNNSINKLKTFFVNEEKKMDLKGNLEPMKLHDGFVLALGKSAEPVKSLEVSNSMIKSIQEEEEIKLMNELGSQLFKENKENDGNAQNSPQRTPKKSSQKSFKSSTIRRSMGESSGLRRVIAKTSLGLKPKKVSFDESTINKTVESISTNKIIINEISTVDLKIEKAADSNEEEVPEEPKIIAPKTVAFSSASGKSINISDADMIKFKNLFQTAEENMDLLDKVKAPQNIGFSFASGKDINIKSTSMDKFKNHFKTAEQNMDLSNDIALMQQDAFSLNRGFMLASGKDANIDSTKLMNIEKRFNEEDEKLKKSDVLKDLESIKNARNEINIGTKNLSIENSNNFTGNNISFGNFKINKSDEKTSFKSPLIVAGSSSNSNGNQNNFSRRENNFTGRENNSTGRENYSTGRENNSNKFPDTGNLQIKTGNMDTGSKMISSENKDTGSKIISTGRKEISIGSKIKETGSNNISNGSKIKETNDSLTGTRIISTGSEQNPQNDLNFTIKRKLSESSDDSDNDISFASQYKISKEFNNSSSGNYEQKVRKSRLRNKSELLKNLKKPCLDVDKMSDDEEENPTKSTEAFKAENAPQNDEEQPLNSKSETDVKDISISCQQPSNELLNNSRSTKNSDTQSSCKSSSIDFNSHRLNSLKRKRMHEDDSEIFNFDSSSFSLKNKKTSTAATPVNKLVDSGIESQDKLANKVESPQMIFKKSAFFSPMFTSSPVINPSTSKTKSKQIEFKRLSETTGRSFSDGFDAVKKRFERSSKPIVAKRLAMDHDDEIIISPIVKNKKRQRRSSEVPINTENIVKSGNYFKRTTLSERLADIDAFMDEQSHIKLMGNDPTASQLVSFLEIEKQQISRFETENRVKNERKEAIEEQMEYVKNKPEDDSRQMTGTMFMMKSGKRRNLKDYVEDEKPHDKNIHEMIFNELLEFKFDMNNYIDQAWSKVSVMIADNAKLIMDETTNVGFNEIKYSFLASYGVDPKLIRPEWLENAYKMILLKFIWMENSFDKIEKFEVLSPENVLLQLKYRYDREIDRHQRPAIRIITERDEVSERRIVLKVMDIVYSLNAGYELELTDGWYKIRTCIDSCLAEAISRKKIVINTKLLICNSELINFFTNAYHPLDLPQGIRLKIHGNSTRIVGYETKLGFCQRPQSFLISVDSISSEGGVIGRLRLFITHVYSMVYVESKGEKKEYRSEKMQNRLENKKEILYSTIFEKIQEQVMNENYNALKERVKKIDRSKIVLSKMPIEEICDILEYESESDLAYAMKSQLTLKQFEKIQEIYHQRKFELNQKIKERLNQDENNVAQLLKFRVVDANKPKKTALVSWWHPSEELLDIVKQRNMIELFKTSSAGKFQTMYSGEIQIHAHKSTVVKLLKTNVEDEKFDKFIRKETRFEEVTNVFSPSNNEFDIACMIVHVDEKSSDGKLQRVYVADEKLNFMSLNFYPCLTDYAYDDVLIEGKILYIRNLQWRKIFKHNNFPEAHAVIDSTIFISNPKDQGQKMRLEMFMNRIEDVGSHLQICREKLETFIGKIPQKATGSKVNNLPSNLKIPASLITNTGKRVLGMKRIPQKYGFS